jgi:hypothetical protein
VAVLSLLSEEATMAEISRRHNVNAATGGEVARPVPGGRRQALLDERLSGPVSSESMAERRLRLKPSC